MNLTQLIYASTASETMSLEDLKQLVSTANSRNQEKHITGFLCSDRHYFIQCLEGDKTKVAKLFDEIQQDARHNTVKILRAEDITTRSFPEWAMGAVLHMDRHLEILGHYNHDKAFQPYELSSDDSLNFLKEFSELRGMH